MRRVLLFIWLTLLLLPWAVEAADYHAATGVGSDFISCGNADGTSPLSSHSKATIKAAMACMVGGDRTVVHTGTYDERLSNYTGAGCPSPATNFPLGSSSAPTRLHTFGTDIVTIFPSSTTGCPIIALTGANTYWLEIKGAFILDGTNVASGSDAIAVDSPGSQVIFDGIEAKNVNSQDPGTTEFGNGALIGGNHITFRNCNLHDNGKGVDNTGGAGYGIYITQSNQLIEHCKIHHNGGFGIQMFNSGLSQNTNDSIIRYNEIYSNGQTATKVEANVIVSSGQRLQIYGNIIRDYAGSGTGLQLGTASGFAWNDYHVYGNTIDGNPRSIDLYPGLTAALIKNNIFSNNTVDGLTDFGATSYTASSNTCTTSGTGCSSVRDPLYIDRAGKNFALTASSSEGDAGADVGFPFNGTAPSRGAFEPWTQVSGEIGTVNASTVTVNFQSAFAPILPLSGCTGWSARVNATPRSLTSCNRSGNAQYQLVLSSAAISTDTVDYSYAVTGSMSDSTQIGGSLNQRLNAITNQAVTNNIAGGGGTFVLTVKHKRVRNYNKAITSNTASDWLWPEDVDGTVRSDGGKIAIANMFDCTVANCPSVGWRYEFNVNGGAYSNVGNSCLVNQVCYDSTDPLQNQGAQITAARLTCGVTFVMGGVIAQDNSFPVIALNTSQCSEVQGEFAVQAGLPNNTQICVRPKPDSAVAITYNTTACFTVVPPAATQASIEPANDIEVRVASNLVPQINYRKPTSSDQKTVTMSVPAAAVVRIVPIAVTQ